jgi:hypothetical protein
MILAAASVPLAQRSRATAFTARDLVGTWIPVWVERLVPGAEPVRVPNPRGVLVFDAAGHAVEVITRGDRAPYAAGQPTPAEAQAAITNFGGFWGGYRVDEARGTITVHVEGAVDPTMMGADVERQYAFADDELTITSTRPRAGAPNGVRSVWQRAPVVETLTPSHRRLIGFWQHVVERREDMNGQVLSESRRAPSVIVYTPTGHVAVHFPPLGREPFAGALPSDEEAQAAIRGYVGYYGVYSLHPGAVHHHRLATLGSAQGDSLRRFYRIQGDEVTLRFPPGTFQGVESRTVVVLRRLSGEPEMRPR